MISTCFSHRVITSLFTMFLSLNLFIYAPEETTLSHPSTFSLLHLNKTTNIHCREILKVQYSITS